MSLPQRKTTLLTQRGLSLSPNTPNHPGGTGNGKQSPVLPVYLLLYGSRGLKNIKGWLILLLREETERSCLRLASRSQCKSLSFAMEDWASCRPVKQGREDLLTSRKDHHKERHAQILSYVSSSASITCQIPEQNSLLFSIHDWRQFWMTKSTAEEHIMKTKCQKVFRKRLNAAREKAACFRH